MADGEFPGNIERPVRAGIFDDQHLAGVGLLCKKIKYLPQGTAQAVFLIVSWDDDGQEGICQCELTVEIDQDAETCQDTCLNQRHDTE